MVFEYILKKNNIDPASDLTIDQSIDFGSTAAAFSGGQGDFTVVKLISFPVFFSLNPIVITEIFRYLKCSKRCRLEHIFLSK